MAASLAYPTTFLIDRAGKIAAIHVGLETKQGVKDEINHLLGGPAVASK